MLGRGFCHVLVPGSGRRFTQSKRVVAPAVWRFSHAPRGAVENGLTGVERHRESGDIAVSWRACPSFLVLLFSTAHAAASASGVRIALAVVAACGDLARRRRAARLASRGGLETGGGAVFSKNAVIYDIYGEFTGNLKISGGHLWVTSGPRRARRSDTVLALILRSSSLRRRSGVYIVQTDRGRAAAPSHGIGAAARLLCDSGGSLGASPASPLFQQPPAGRAGRGSACAQKEIENRPTPRPLALGRDGSRWRARGSDGSQGAHFRLNPEPKYEPLGLEFEPLAPLAAANGGVEPTKTGQSLPHSGAKVRLRGAPRRTRDKGKKWACGGGRRARRRPAD